MLTDDEMKERGVIKVQPWSDEQGAFVLINEHDFDRDFHKYLNAPAKAAKKAEK